MKYFSTFSGIGGFELGIGDVAECVGFSEVDKYATQIYKKHFPNHKNYGDITRIAAESIPDFDLFVGGFPCQSFSIAGKRAGFQDTRGTLFFDIARILKHKRPRYILLENVKGLLSHDNGKTFQTILTVLTDIGYHIQWQVLNSKNFGVPQNRERVFIVGHLRGTPRPEVFPIGGSSSENKNPGPGLTPINFKHKAGDGMATRSRKRTELSCTLAAKPGQNGAMLVQRRQIIQLNKPKHSNDRIYSDEGLSPTLNTMQGGNRQPFIKVDESLNGMVSCKHGKTSKLDDRTLEGKEKLRRKEECLLCMQEKEKDRHPPQERGLARQPSGELRGDVSDLPLPSSQSNKDMQSGEMQQENEKVRILRETRPEVQEVGKSSQDKTQSILQGARIRRLTCVECERLQGFPDGWTEGLSDTQRYKCLGNAVTVNVIQAIIEKLI